MSHTSDQGAGGFKIAVSWPAEVDYALDPSVIKNRNRRQSPSNRKSIGWT